MMSRMMSRSLSGAALACLLVGALLSAPAGGAPVCAELPRALCGGRIFAEPESSVSFVQHDTGEYEAGILALAEEFPRFVRVRTFSEIFGEPTLSAGGREIYLVEVTDFEAPERGKQRVAVSLSVHGPERAGLEGGVRYIEDLARWASDDPDHVLANGTEPDSTEVTVGAALRRVHLYFANINPDGWAAGDAVNGGIFMRGNANGVDLNREFPTIGWTKMSYTPLSEPESIAWHRLMRRVRPDVASDLHGELTSANDAFADLMYPAGQWDPLEQAREERLARHMKSNVERYFELDGVPLETATGVAGMRPAEYATGYDVVGYDDSGFMGDYFTQRYGALELDVEHFVSHMVPNSLWFAPLEQAHVAAVRGEIEALIVEAIVAPSVRVRLDLGRVGYLYDPEVVSDADGAGGQPKDADFKPYRATRMRYFEHLARYTTQPVERVAIADVARGALDGLDSFVIADEPFPRDPKGRRVDRNAYVRALKAWVRAGGNLVLTDEALTLLEPLGIVPGESVRRDLYNAGHVVIDDFDDPYLKGVHTTAGQTYYEVPLGYPADEDASPHYTVDAADWERAGGVALAHTGDQTRVSLGRVELGRGTIGIFGAVLPTQSERYPHLYGLADYAVTVAGGQILHNMLAF